MVGCELPLRDGTEKPDCDCHGEPMWWHNDPRVKLGGYWRCSARERERSRRRYWADPIAGARRMEERDRTRRIARMTSELKELIGAT